MYQINCLLWWTSRARYSKGIYNFFYEGRFELLVSNNVYIANPVSTEQKDVSGMLSGVRRWKKVISDYD